MNQAAQQISPDPARDFANAILAETNNARDLIDLLLEISQGNYDASTNDQITANKILTDRGLGKCPKSTPVLSQARPEPEPALSLSKGRRVEGPVTDPTPNPAPETDDNDVEAIRESPSAVPHEGPESPRLVTQLDDSLNQSLGPAPKALPEPANEEPALSLSKGHSRVRGNPESPDPFDPSYIQSSIQNYILEITDNGRTIRTALIGIAFAGPENPAVTPYHRNRAVTLLLDRILGTNPALALSSVEAWPEHGPAPDAAERDRVEDLRSDEERWAKIEADLKRMEDEGILTPDPNGSPIDISNYRMPKDFDSTPYEEEEFAAFKAEIELRVERQKQWPEIEERRRKKLAQIYPSHTDGEQPDT